VLSIRDDALEVWRTVHDATEADMREGGDLYHIRSWAQKYAGHVARIAALLHCMEADPSDLISAANVRGAAKVGEYLKSHALSAFSVIGRKQDVVTGRVLAWIKRHQLLEFIEADCYRDLRRGEVVNESADLKPAYDELERRGFIRVAPFNHFNSPGRPQSPTYKVNPAILKGGESE
jgi:hypothetical protein